MKSLTGPLTMIAAALIWLGSGIFHAGGKRDYAEISVTGALVACAILVIGLAFTFIDRSRG